jgi:hypothetical protein
VTHTYKNASHTQHDHDMQPKCFATELLHFLLFFTKSKLAQCRTAKTYHHAHMNVCNVSISLPSELPQNACSRTVRMSRDLRRLGMTKTQSADKQKTSKRTGKISETWLYIRNACHAAGVLCNRRAVFRIPKTTPCGNERVLRCKFARVPRQRGGRPCPGQKAAARYKEEWPSNYSASGLETVQSFAPLCSSVRMHDVPELQNVISSFCPICKS